MKPVKTGDRNVGEVVEKIQKDEPKVGKVGRSARFGQEQNMKPGQDAIPAEAGEEHEFSKCFDDITGKKLSWHAANEARAKELKFLRELGVYEKVDEHEAVGKYNVTQVNTECVNTVRGFEEKPGRR